VVEGTEGEGMKSRNYNNHNYGNNWIVIPPKMGDPVFKCPKCGHRTLSPTHICENCGKQMHMGFYS